MYCTKCGNQIEENSKFCSACGTPIKPIVQEKPEQPFCQPAQSAESAQSTSQPLPYSYNSAQNNTQQTQYPQQVQNPVYQYQYGNYQHSIPINSNKTPTDKKLKRLLFSSFVLCILGIIMPFLSWIEFPELDNALVQGVFNLFGGEGDISSFSPFSICSFISDYGASEDVVIFYVMLAVLIIAMLFYVAYIIFGLMKKRFCTVFSLIGSIIMLHIVAIYTFAFIVASEQISYIEVNITAVPWLAIIFAIGNIVMTGIIMAVKGKPDSTYFKR